MMKIGDFVQFRLYNGAEKKFYGAPHIGKIVDIITPTSDGQLKSELTGEMVERADVGIIDNVPGKHYVVQYVRLNHCHYSTLQRKEIERKIPLSDLYQI